MAADYFSEFGDISERKNKKYKVFVDGDWIHFGDTRYEHFSNDKIPPQLRIYKTHGDPERRQNYLTRAYGIKNGKSKNDPKSANYWSIHILW